MVDNEVVLLRKGTPKNPNHLVSIEFITEDNIFVNSIPQVKWKRLDGAPINIFITEKDENVLNSIIENSITLESICDVAAGLKPYEVGKGSPPQTKKMLKERVYDASYQKDFTYLPLLRGRDIEQYLIKWDGGRWIKYGANLASPRSPANFNAPEKIVIRQTGDSLVAALDTSQFVCMNNMHTINSKDINYDLRFVLALINSTLMNYYFQSLNPEKGEALAEVKKEHVANLQIFKARKKQQKLLAMMVNYITHIKQLLMTEEKS